MIDIKAQYIIADVDEAEYPDHEEPGEHVSFDNKSTTWFTQLSFRPSLVESEFVRYLEFVARYSSLLTPEDAEWHVDQTQWDVRYQLMAGLAHINQIQLSNQQWL